MSKGVFIIAEAGVNHNGSIELAKKLIEAAALAGADAIKFQSFKADRLVSKKAEKAAYQKETSNACETQYNMLKKLELDESAHQELMAYCKERKIEFLSSAFDLGSIDLLRSLGLKKFKIPSGEITNLPYLQKIGALKTKVILSTGMANIGEIEDAIDVLVSAGTVRDDITILHCNTEYPTPFEDVNLTAMVTIREALKVRVGYSDHTLGIEVPIAAVALGAEIIEKHFTLDKNMEGPDHKASLEPVEFETMVRAIRNIEMALGSGVKKPSPSERKNLLLARKSIHTSRPVMKGELFTEKNLTMLRPGDGIPPSFLATILGRVARNDLADGMKLRWEDVL